MLSYCAKTLAQYCPNSAAAAMASASSVGHRFQPRSLACFWHGGTETWCLSVKVRRRARTLSCRAFSPRGPPRHSFQRIALALGVGLCDVSKPSDPFTRRQRTKQERTRPKNPDASSGIGICSARRRRHVANRTVLVHRHPGPTPPHPDRRLRVAPVHRRDRSDARCSFSSDKASSERRRGCAHPRSPFLPPRDRRRA
jgi:hypothetical protein